MAATSDEQTNLLLSSFDQIYEVIFSFLSSDLFFFASLAASTILNSVSFLDRRKLNLVSIDFYFHLESNRFLSRSLIEPIERDIWKLRSAHFLFLSPIVSEIIWNFGSLVLQIHTDFKLICSSELDCSNNPTYISSIFVSLRILNAGWMRSMFTDQRAMLKPAEERFSRLVIKLLNKVLVDFFVWWCLV